MDNKLSTEENEAINDALLRGQKIEAIKLYREASGNDLKASKEFIDALSVKLADQDPEKYAKLAKGSGCASVILITLGLSIFGLSWLLDTIA